MNPADIALIVGLCLLGAGFMGATDLVLERLRQRRSRYCCPRCFTEMED